MLHFILGTAGTGKTSTVRNRIVNEVKEGKSGIILLTPEQYTFESEKALLKSLGATAADRAEVLSFTKLIEYIGGDLKEFIGKRADNGIKAVAMKRALVSIKDDLLVYNNTKPTAEFILSMLGIITELKQSGIDSMQLGDAAVKINNKTFSNKIHDVSLIYSAYTSILAEKYLDSDDDLDRLNVALFNNRFFKGKTVYVDAFDGFTAQQYKIIEHIIRDADDVHFSFCTDSMNDEKDGTGLFSNVKKEIRQIKKIADNFGIKTAPPEVFTDYLRFDNDALVAVEHILRDEDYELTENGDDVTICKADTIYDEVDFAARTIKKMVRLNKYRYRDITVIVRDIESYRQLFDSAFNRYGIPCYLDKRADNIDLMLTSYLDNVIKTAVIGFSQDVIFSLLKSPLSFMNIEDVSELENYVYIWNIKPRDWYSEWTANPDGIDAEMNDEKLALINNLRNSAVDFLQPIKKAVDSEETKEICTALYNFLVKSNVPDKIKEYAAKLESDGNNFLADLQYKSWDLVVELLDKIVTVSSKYIKPSELIDTYELLLKCESIGTIPSRLDEVMIGDAYRIRPCNPKIVFILGANYREMPKPPSNNGILSIIDRGLLKECDVNINDRIESDAIKERYVIYSSVCSASEKIFISYHDFDSSHSKVEASDFVNLIKDKLNLSVHNEADSRMDRFESKDSLIEYIAENFNKLGDDFDFGKFDLDNAEILNNAFDTMLNGIDENISSITTNKYKSGDMYLSPSRVETFSKCPFMYFCTYDMKAKKIDKAEISSRNRGTIAHYVLENILKKYSAKISELSDDEIINEIEFYTNEYILHHFAGFDIDEKRFVFTVERIKNLLLDVIKNIGQEFAQSEFEPIAFEEKIGTEGEIKPLKIPVDDGNVMIIGTIDRVDIFKKDDKAYIRVIDYKTGKKTFSLSDILYGLNMQMLLYLFSYIESKSDENAKPAGVLYMPVKYNDFVESNDDVDKLSFTMNGLINIEDRIPEAMERDAEMKFVPYSYKKDGEYRAGSLYSSDDFDDIKKKIVSVVQSIASRMKQGDISRSPLFIDGGAACKYCDYREVCLSADTNLKVAKRHTNTMEIIRNEVRENETDG